MYTRKKRCDCEHKDQDKMHGKKVRVHNYKETGTTNWRCTVCNKEK